MTLSPAILSEIQGTPFGTRPDQRPQTYDGRTAALRVLRRYVAELTFYRAGAVGGAPVPFTVTADRFFIERGDTNDDATYPAIVVKPGKGVYRALGLGTYVDEESADVYAPGTALQYQSEYAENLRLELRAGSKPELRSLVVGLEQALVPTETMYGIRFVMREYFDQLACFALGGKEVSDEEDDSRNRWKAWLDLELTHNVVALVAVARLDASVEVQVDVDSVGVEVVIDPDDPMSQVLPVGS